MIFLHWPQIQRDALRPGPQVQSTAGHISQEGESEISEESGSKVTLTLFVTIPMFTKVCEASPNLKKRMQENGCFPFPHRPQLHIYTFNSHVQAIAWT